MSAPNRCPTCGHTPRRETRSYADRAESMRRAARARARGYTGPGALARYRHDVRRGKLTDPPAPPEDHVWAHAAPRASAREPRQRPQ